MRIQDHRIATKINKKMDIVAFPDGHFGSEAFLKDEYGRLVDYISSRPNAATLFLGDLIDDDRPSTRLLRRSMYNDRSDAFAQEDVKHLLWLDEKVIPKMKKFLDPAKCLGMLEGDHYRRYSNGLTSTQYLCSKLKIPYLGDGQAVLRLHFELAVGKKSRLIQIHCQHGIGGTGRPGNAVNKLEDTAKAWQGMDMFVRAHSHRAFIYPISQYSVSPRGREIIQKDIWLANTSSLRTGFIINKTDYAERKNYGATAHKYPVFHLMTKRLRVQRHKIAIEDRLVIDIAGELI